MREKETGVKTKPSRCRGVLSGERPSIKDKADLLIVSDYLANWRITAGEIRTRELRGWSIKRGALERWIRQERVLKDRVELVL